MCGDVLLECFFPFDAKWLGCRKNDRVMFIKDGVDPVFTSCFFFDEGVSCLYEFSEML